jgi:hypothetical protein
MNKRGISRAAAYHEAGHAVARIYVGAPATDTAVFENGSGYSDGHRGSWRSANPGIGALWDFILVSMAGAYSEARATKRSIEKIRLSHGLKDYAAATCLVIILAKRSGGVTERAIWRQIERERTQFLRYCWKTIEMLADRLLRTGFVSREELRTLTRRYRRRLSTLQRPGA